MLYNIKSESVYDQSKERLFLIFFFFLFTYLCDGSGCGPRGTVGFGGSDCVDHLMGVRPDH